VKAQRRFDFISFMARNVEYVFMCLLAFCTSCFETCLFSLFAHLFIGVFDLGDHFYELSVCSDY
jgi:hypothetical protein